MMIANKHSDSVKIEPDFLNNVNKGDEIFAFDSNPETKSQSAEWHNSRFSNKKRQAQISKS